MSVTSAPLLVQQGCQIDPERRFAGVARLYGSSGAERISRAHVAVVGIGGVGSWAAEALARSGVGALTLIDLDHVAESNVNRQVHALDATLGQAKVVAMGERIRQINSRCQVTCVEEFAAADNWPGLLQSPVDGVVDACDQMQAKAMIAAWALATRTLFITAGAAGGKRLGHCVEVDDLSVVTHDPLLARLRHQLRRAGVAPKPGKRFGVSSVFSRETVVRAASAEEGAHDHSLNCHGYGSSVSVTATFGLCAAGWMLDQIARTAVSGKKNATI